MADAGIIAAFIGGLFSFFSPCVLPLVPIYISILSGLSYGELVSASERKDLSILLRVTLHAVFFVLGFSVAFILMGASASLLGQWLNNYRIRIWIVRLGGVLVFIFGLYFLGVFRFRWLSMEKRVNWKPGKASGVGAAAMGFIFALAWTPCVSYVLVGILTIAADRAQLHQGVFLLSAYSLGLGLPFIVTAMMFAKMLEVFKAAQKWMGWIEKLSGAFLVIIGILLLSGLFTQFTARLSRLGTFFD